MFLSASVCIDLSFFFFFFNDTATTEIYTLSLHDALPIWRRRARPVQPLLSARYRRPHDARGPASRAVDQRRAAAALAMDSDPLRPGARVAGGDGRRGHALRRHQGGARRRRRRAVGGRAAAS